MRKFLVFVTKLIACLSMTIFAGCAETPVHAIDSPVYQEKSNQFSPDETHYYGDSITIKDNPPGKPDFSFLRLNFTKTNKSRIWHINTFYISKSYILDQILILVVDGKVSTFSSEPHPKRGFGRLYKGYADESSQFKLPDSFIADLHNAKSVVVRITGQNYFQEKTLLTADIGHLINFINHINSLPID